MCSQTDLAKALANDEGNVKNTGRSEHRAGLGNVHVRKRVVGESDTWATNSFALLSQVTDEKQQKATNEPGLDNFPLFQLLEIPQAKMIKNVLR